MQNGSYYPKAIESAVRAIYGDKTAEILATPNNVLAVEYLKALPSNISPLPIRREGVEHDSENTENGFASASYIREQLKQGGFQIIGQSKLCRFKRSKLRNIFALL